MQHHYHSAGMLAVLLTLSFIPVAGQSMFGLRVGPSIGTFAGADARDYTTHPALSLSASFTMPMARGLGVQVGAGYVQKGARNVYGYGTDIVMTYVELPVLLQIGAQTEGGVSLLLGPHVAFLTSCRAMEDSGMGVARVPCPQFDRFNISRGTYVRPKTFDFGLVGGVQLQSAATRRVRMILDALYEVGLGSFEKESGDLRNRALVIRVGVGVVSG